MFYRKILFFVVVSGILFNTACSAAEDAFAAALAGEAGTACPEVVTYARAPYQGCWVSFNTPCDVPQGWKHSYAIPDGEFECAPVGDCNSVGMPNPDAFCANFNLFKGTLNIPCFIYGDKRFELEFSIQGAEPPVFVLKSYKSLH